MCLTCGCMQAHLEMGKHNIVYEDVKRAADETAEPSRRRSTSSPGPRTWIAPIIPMST